MRLDRPESQGKGKSLGGIFTFLSFFVKLVFGRFKIHFSFTRIPGPDVLPLSKPLSAP